MLPGIDIFICFVTYCQMIEIGKEMFLNIELWFVYIFSKRESFAPQLVASVHLKSLNGLSLMTFSDFF